ncbi:MAG: YihY/virulence factor BrkB family protein [Actinomycetales bacterium]|nr:YihY/virulence factor BrkB family protein [Actinomycetales bacterium]
MRSGADRLRGTRVLRAWDRYRAARGEVFAGGMAYHAFLLVLPALVIGFTVLGHLLTGDPELRRRLVENVNATTGVELIGIGQGDRGVVVLDELFTAATLRATGVLGGVLFVLAALGWLNATREGVRAVFDRPPLRPGPVTRLADLLVLATLGLVLLSAAVAEVVLTSATDWALTGLGLGGSTTAEAVLTSTGVLVVLAVDSAVLVALFRVALGRLVPVRELVVPGVIGGAGLGVFKALGGVVLSTTAGSPVALALAVSIGVLVWMNLTSRILLLVAALAAETAADHGYLPLLGPWDVLELPEPRTAPRRGRGEVRRATAPIETAGAAPGSVPAFGTRSEDRVALAAGATLGVAAVLGLGTLHRAATRMRGLLRRA